MPSKNSKRSDDRNLDKAKSKSNKSSSKGGKQADQDTENALKRLGKLFGA